MTKQRLHGQLVILYSFITNLKMLYHNIHVCVSMVGVTSPAELPFMATV